MKIWSYLLFILDGLWLQLPICSYVYVFHLFSPKNIKHKILDEFMKLWFDIW